MTQNQKIFTPQVQEIRDYILELLEYLDGRGLVLEDDELIEKALDSLGSFSRLREIFEIYSNDVSELNVENLPDIKTFLENYNKPTEIETWKCGDCGGDCSAITCPEEKNGGDYTECQNCHEEISWELFAKNTGLCFECSDQLQ